MPKQLRWMLLLLLLAALGATPALAQHTDARLDAAEAAEGFELSRAYPNPFNPSTQVTLTVERPQRVAVEVYNLLGRRVAVLHDGELAAQQRYTFTFEAGTLPSGIYLIRVSGDTFATTRRVTLLK